MEIEDLKRGIVSEDYENAKKSAENLVKIGGDGVLEFLIGLLELAKPEIRNRAALALREIENNRAIEPLLKSILKPENKNYNGTMVYALQKLDCKYKLVEIFKILFSQGYEAKIGAYSILDRQVFEFSRDDLKEIQEMWKDYNLNPEKGEGFDNEKTKLMMQEAYDGFMEYI